MLEVSTDTNSQGVKIPNLAKTFLDLFPVHPFANVHDKAHMRPLMQNYLAMSMAFPYLQSASCSESILHCLRNGDEVPEFLEKTTIVGSFLVWDELGGWHNTYKKAHAGLPKILDSKQVHANLLRLDIKAIFGEELKARFDEPTKQYLLRFYQDLSSLDPTTKCAAMVSFELHAERMISSLWHSVSQLYALEKDNLKYFSAHVGGDDPAEAYHVKMTQNMVDTVISQENQHKFIAEAVRIYFTHFQWCDAITHINIH